jgi:hypothetical protein
MKNIILTISMVLIPFIAFANTFSEINELMDRIRSNSKAYRVICYSHQRHVKANGFTLGALDINNRDEYCLFLKEEIENDIDMVLKLRGKK